MTPHDRGIRDLLPLLKSDPRELGVAAEEDPSGPVLGTALPQVRIPDGRSSDEPSHVHGQPSPATPGTPSPTHSPPPSSTLHVEQSAGHVDGSTIVAPSSPVEPGVFAPTFLNYPIVSGGHAGSDGPGRSPSGAEAAGEEPTHGGGRSPGADSTEAGSAPQGSSSGQGVTSGGEDVPADHASGPAGEADGGHDITVTQVADVEQDATIVIEGYMGSVVSRFRIDQKILMDQDAEVEINIDGSGHFAITIDQRMYISQQTDVEVSIFDDDGVLYVDLFLRDVIEVDQETSVLFNLYDGFGDNDLVVIQDLEMDQDADVAVDVEDELEERYSVKVDVAVLQDVDADEEANLHITNHAGELEVDLEATQTASVDQETFVRIDFALI